MKNQFVPYELALKLKQLGLEESKSFEAAKKDKHLIKEKALELLIEKISKINFVN